MILILVLGVMMLVGLFLALAWGSNPVEGHQPGRRTLRVSSDPTPDIKALLRTRRVKAAVIRV